MLLPKSSDRAGERDVGAASAIVIRACPRARDARHAAARSGSHRGGRVTGVRRAAMPVHAVAGEHHPDDRRLHRRARGRGRGAVQFGHLRVHQRPPLLQGRRQHRHPRRQPLDRGRHPPGPGHLLRRDGERLAAGQLLHPGRRHGRDHLRRRLPHQHRPLLRGRGLLHVQQLHERPSYRSWGQPRDAERALRLQRHPDLPHRHLQRHQLLGRRRLRGHGSCVAAERDLALGTGHHAGVDRLERPSGRRVGGAVQLGHPRLHQRPPLLQGRRQHRHPHRQPLDRGRHAARAGHLLERDRQRVATGHLLQSGGHRRRHHLRRRLPHRHRPLLGGRGLLLDRRLHERPAHGPRRRSLQPQRPLSPTAPRPPSRPAPSTAATTGSTSSTPRLPSRCRSRSRPLRPRFRRVQPSP